MWLTTAANICVHKVQILWLTHSLLQSSLLTSECCAAALVMSADDTEGKASISLTRSACGRHDSHCGQCIFSLWMWNSCWMGFAPSSAGNRRSFEWQMQPVLCFPTDFQPPEQIGFLSPLHQTKSSYLVLKHFTSTAYNNQYKAVMSHTSTRKWS